MGGYFLLDKQKILKFLGYKLVRFAILLVVVILLSFILIDMSPINPVNAYISNMVVSPEKVAQLEAYWGVNQPITEKLLNWLGNIIVGDFGTSLISTRVRIYFPPGYCSTFQIVRNHPA